MTDFVSAEVLAEELRDDFPGWVVSVDREYVISLQKNVIPYTVSVDRCELFEMRIRDYLLQYTNCWTVVGASSNRIEGYYHIVIELEN